MNYKVIPAALACTLLAGCGGPTIDKAEAEEIAALSQDSDKHLQEFTKSVLSLSGEKSCQAEYMRESGAFWRSSNGLYYFIHCGTLYSEDNIQTWYYSPQSKKLVRVKAAL